MVTVNRHWTQGSTDAFLFRVATDFVTQIEQAMEKDGTKQAELAKALGVSESRVSQVLNTPGNLTLKKIIKYARAIGKKVSLVCYDDNDPDNRNGPINSEIFQVCWERAGRPDDFFALRGSQAAAANIDFVVEEGGTYRFTPKHSANLSSTDAYGAITQVAGTAGNSPNDQPEVRII